MDTNYYHQKSSVFAIMAMFLLFLFFASTVSAKSLYVITNINANPTPMQTYDIQAAPAYLVFQANAGVPALAGGAVGLGLDDASAKLFVTYEGSGTLQLVDAKTFKVLRQITAPGASNLAGIVVDQGKKKVYTVDRETNRLYVYSWDATTDTLTLDGGAFKTLAGVVQANGIALDEKRGRLYIGDKSTTTVRYFDTSTWTEAGNFVLSQSGQTAMGIAVDQVRNIVYTGNAYPPYGSKGMLVKYDLNTTTETFYTLPGAAAGDNIVGVAVDEDTGNVYVTTGNQGTGGTDTLIVFDSSLNVLKNDLSDLGNPTGIVIPRGQVSYNPLNFTKTASQDPAISGKNLTYDLCYDNLANQNPVSGVNITDTLPQGASFVSATGNYTIAGSDVKWNIGTVAGGATKACQQLTVLVTASAGATLTNNAVITFGEGTPTTVTLQTPVKEAESTAVTTPYTLSGKGGGGSFGLLELAFGLVAAAFAFLVRRQRIAAVAMMGGLAMVTVMAASPVQADWYAGVGGGLTRGDFSSSTLENHLIAKGYNTPPNAITSVGVDNTDSGWKLFGGYQFNRFLAAEVSRVNLGDTKSTVRGSLTTPPSDIPTLLNDAADAHGYLARGWTLAGVGIWPVKPTVSLFAKGGIFRWKADINITEVNSGQSVSRDENGSNGMFGIGIKHMPNPKWELRAEIERYKVSNDWVDFLSLGLGYHF